MPDPQTEQIMMPMQPFEALFNQESADAENRTIELVFYSGARVQRYNWQSGKYYDLEFVVDDVSADLARLNKGAPLLNSHSQYDLNQILGVVEKAWLDNGTGKARVRFSSRADVEPIWNDVRNGIIRSISMGTDVRKYELIEGGGEGGRELWRATSWQPFELSLVAVPADADAKTMLANQPKIFPCLLHRVQQAQQPEEEVTMAALKQDVKTNDTGEELAKQVENAGAVVMPAAQDLALIERERCTEIMKGVQALGLEQKLADELIASGVTLDAARKRIFDLAVEAGQAASIRAHCGETILSAVDEQMPLEQRCKAEWEKSSDLRSEFGEKFERYLSFKKAEANGQVKLFQRK